MRCKILGLRARFQHLEFGDCFGRGWGEGRGRVALTRFNHF